MQRVLGGERRQLRHARGGPAGVDLLPEVDDEGVKPQPVKAEGMGRRELAGVRERGPAPQREGLSRLPFRQEPFKAERVHVRRSDGQPVPGC